MKTGRRSDEHSMLCAVATIVSILLPSAAAAHVGQGDVGGGFLAGVLHPISGLDHVVAMVAVGIWGAQ
jgi:urease accessory protein